MTITADLDEFHRRMERLDWTIELLGRALDAGCSLAAVFPSPINKEPGVADKANEAIERRKSLLNTARYEFRTTLKHDLAETRCDPPALLRRIAELENIIATEMHWSDCDNAVNRGLAKQIYDGVHGPDPVRNSTR